MMDHQNIYILTDQKGRYDIAPGCDDNPFIQDEIERLKRMAMKQNAILLAQIRNHGRAELISGKDIKNERYFVFDEAGRLAIFKEPTS